MIFKTKLLLSLGALGVVGGTGAGIYYGTKNFSESSVETQIKIPFSGSLIFSQKNKINDENSTTSKIYEAELSTNQESFSEQEKCKFEEKTLKCKIFNLSNKKEVDKYLEELNKKLIVLNSDDDSELPKKLREKLVEEKEEFEKIFGSEIYTRIEGKLPSSN